jgi:hypothetical protein
LLACTSESGAWAGVVGRPDLGLVAAAEAGVALERLALVPYPGADLVAVVAALLDGLDLVAVAVPGQGMRAGDRQRLAGRARQRGAVLLPLGPWPGADAELSCVPGPWQGTGGQGTGGQGSQGADGQDTGGTAMGGTAMGGTAMGGTAMGGGRLRARRVCVRLRGRGVAPASHEATLLLPDPDGHPTTAPAPAPAVARLQEAG